jgi:hypothetical protein
MTIPFKDKTCAECGVTFKPRRYDQDFCASKCGAVQANREMVRAKRLYRALYHWRMSRDNKEDFAFVCREIASWAEADKAAGRKRPPRHRHDHDRGHQVRRNEATGS